MSVWTRACRLVSRYLSEGKRLDHLLEAGSANLEPGERRRCRFLVYGVVRHLALLDAALKAHLRRRPRPLLRAVLLVGAYELLEDPEATPRIVHHAVGQARLLLSAREAGLVNAVLRRSAITLREWASDRDEGASAMARRFSHPEWMVRRWLAAWGSEATKALLAWNQRPAATHARVVGGRDRTPLPPFFRETPWPGFFRLEQADWEVVERMLRAGEIYLQDPATRLAPEAMAAAPGEVLLDLCSAPGGKALQLAEAVGEEGRVVAGDLAGPRLERLKENVARHAPGRIEVVALDLGQPLPAQLERAGQPTVFAGVLIDVPCSNTGVLQHRVDVKWRLRPEDIPALTETQLRMLRHAAAVVAPGGRLVYSTCSLEPEENAGVVERFLAESDGAFALEQAVRSLPWESGCDGAGVFRLRRREA